MHPPDDVWLTLTKMALRPINKLGAERTRLPASEIADSELSAFWLQSTRRWMIVSWYFLSQGLILGMLWAYETLGWGGYWGWDPVENAGFLPWLTATAFLHAMMIQERRGMMKIWNVS